MARRRKKIEEKKVVKAPEAKAVKPVEVKPVEVKPVEAKPVEAKKEAVKGEDLFLVLGGEKHQFSSQISPIYACKEYFLKAEFKKDAAIRFEHANGEEVPVHHSANCGYTLVGKAQKLFHADKALVANGEASDDQEYVYINEHSTLHYVGEDGVHTLFVRVYDNIYGENDDRWAVVYID